MTARERILRDNGLLMLAAAVAVAAAGNASAARRPAPHNFPKPPHVLRAPTSPATGNAYR